MPLVLPPVRQCMPWQTQLMKEQRTLAQSNSKFAVAASAVSCVNILLI
jgi:hypothetical protein